MTQKENEKNKSIQAAIQADIQRTLDSLHLPEYKEIPDVGLYLEQVTTLCLLLMVFRYRLPVI